MKLTFPGPLALLAMLSILPSACAPGPFRGSFADLAERDLGPLSAQDRTWLDRAHWHETSPPASTTASDQPVTLDDFIERALADNPRIHAATQRIARLNERIPQVTSLDDPMVMLSPIGSMAETAAGEVGLMSSVSQRLPYPGKLDTRGKVAQQDVAIAQAELERLRLMIIADTRRAWWSLYYAVRAIEITNSNHALLTQMREVVKARYRTGNATQESILRMTVEIHNLENELLALNQRRTTAVAMLNTLVNQPAPAPVADPPPIELAGINARLDDLLAQATQQNPDLRAMRERMTQYRHRRELARLARYPDFTFGLSYNIVEDEGLSMAANGQDQWWLSVGANIPIWTEKLDAGERESTRGILETAGMVAGEQNRIAFQINDAIARIESQHQQAIALRDLIIPEAQQTIEVALSGYRTGRVTFDALIDNWRKLLSFQLMYESMISQLERSVAELDEAIGSSVMRTAPMQTTQPVDNPAEMNQ